MGMKLTEVDQSSLSFSNVVSVLGKRLGTLQRVGGPRRVYTVDGAQAACFVIPRTGVGIGIAWRSNAVSTIYMWKAFSINKSPDYAIDLPNVSFDILIDPIVKLLRSPRIGKIDVALAEDDQSRSMSKDEENLVNAINATKNRDLLMAAKAKAINAAYGSGSIVLMGRRPDGTLFEVPGMDDFLAQLERLAAAKYAVSQTSTSRSGSMEEQYRELASKVGLVIGGQSEYVRALLLLGAPSSGKSFNVMKTIREHGLTAGQDYVLKKGKLSTVSLYRLLIEQIDGLLIFDDCDGVLKDQDAVNILKGALDTDPVRQVSYDVRGTLNTAVMSEEERIKLVDAMSRIFRGVPEDDDTALFDKYVPNTVKVDLSQKEIDAMGLSPDEVEAARKYLSNTSPDRVHQVEQWLITHMPNLIDYRGRIIFISNLSEKEWDGAITSRSFMMNMKFTSEEMLDYIEGVLPYMGKSLTIEQKQEVLNYLRALHEAGIIKKDINFRIVQQAFDLRKLDDWKWLCAGL